MGRDCVCLCDLAIAVTKFIHTLVCADGAVVNVGAPLTMYFGPTSILLALDVEFQKGLSAPEITAAVDRLEKAVRGEYPQVERIFIEAEALSPVRKEVNSRRAPG